ncbi:PTI1-like tyrosine-protein kinase [Iris pallida]|uniref:PTI1-like tyrosine-protein kinase n=1 Tax=Iris pallida TaxID=29817 RepID=A0AAX6EVA2_IRIPA|nr:PTI1-like tyrosine-protein kinase [Iris pallida]KAJ6829986.1 PTI1-like tyrosine-protein kinase [Iris pallida]
MGVACGKPTDRFEFSSERGRWRIFSRKDLRAATNSFSYDNKFGEEESGSLYWGQLWDGSQIAVKRLRVYSEKAETEFVDEVEMLGSVRHKNLLNLRGYCAEGQECLIVYDYMPNLSLHAHLHGLHSDERLLDWSRRMSIAIGTAEGIAYLHHHATPPIIHRDVKASNVWLDSEFRAHIAGFGFAKLIPDGAAHVATTRVHDTKGYLAPEYAINPGKASEACDVYSFGILLLELATGRRPIDKSSPAAGQTITSWALPLAREKKFEELADLRLGGNFVKEEMKRVAIVALVCAQSDPERRPTMLEVVKLLKGQSKERFSSLENDEMFRPDRTESFDGGKDVIEEDDSATDAVAPSTL